MITKEEYIAFATSTGRQMSKRWYDKVDKMFADLDVYIKRLKNTKE